MNIFDVVIILIILMMGVVGMKRGFFKELVMVVGTILVLVLSFQFKDPLANFFCKSLPFFDFKGLLHGATSLSIVLYQLLAFLLIAIILFAVLRILIGVTGVFEKILNFTIILGIPSKILGFIVGLIEGVVVMFFVLVILSIPLQSVDLFMESGIRTKFVTEMPILKDSVGGINEAVEDIYKIASNKQDENQFNYDVMEVLLKYKVVKADLAEDLVKQGKLSQIAGIDNLINQYR